MPSPEKVSRLTLLQTIFAQEIRGVLLSPSFWMMLIVISLLTGYSFFQAVDLFSQASRTALSYPELSRGMNPQTGIFIPTFGAYYLTQTLLLPFVAIQLIGQDKQTGTLKLLLQLDLSPLTLCSLKLLALLLVWIVSLIPAFSVLLFWQKMGGHVSVAEIALQFVGHGLYALTVVTLCLFVAVISDSLPTAAMVCLAFTLGSWVLDFAVSGQDGILGTMGAFSLAGLLRDFENGLLLNVNIFIFAILSLFFFSMAVCWLHPGKRLINKMSWSCLIFFVLCLALGSSRYLPGFWDLTENRQHSLNPADSRTLRRLSLPLRLTLHYNAQDSRLHDLKKNVLAKLARNVNELQISYVRSTSTGMFGASDADDYGIIEYEYNHRHDQSYSNSQEEILSIIYGLADMQVHPDTVAVYPGYPLVVEKAYGSWWMYGVLPGIFFISGLLFCWKKL